MPRCFTFGLLLLGMAWILDSSGLTYEKIVLAQSTTQDEPKKAPPKEQPKESSKRDVLPQPLVLNEAWLKAIQWRCIGPANMGGRITAISVYEADPSIYYVATASGGLLKTTNNGITFTHQFDKEATVSIGDVCVSQTNPDIVWVGTGEANPRNSVSYGDGVYKSIDGGKTWQNMGLKKSFQIGKIVIHPKNPDIVYVGALGRLYGPNEERGLFKTVDGGKTWQKIHYVDDKTGVIDIAMNPAEPDTLLVATYERLRGIYDDGDPIKRWGAGSGLYRTTDGGKTFEKITAGLPTCKLGRIGLNFYRKDPKTVFAIVESEKIGMGKASGKAPEPKASSNVIFGMVGEDHPMGARLVRITRNGPAEKAGLKADDVILSYAGKEIKKYQDLLDEVRKGKVGDKVKVKYLRGKETGEVEVTLQARSATAGGTQSTGTGNRPNSAHLGGQRENIQDRQGADGQEYGGIYKSIDGGLSWKRINSLNPRPFYFSMIRVDPTDDRNLYVAGISLHRSRDGGKTFTPDAGRGVHADHHAMWIDPRDPKHIILGCDGGIYQTYDRAENWDHLNHIAIAQFYHVAIDTRRDYNVYGGLQDNGSWGGPNLKRTLAGTLSEDWLSINGGDGFVCRVDPNDPDQVYATSQYGRMMRLNFRTGERGSIQPADGTGHRFNWNTPFLLSYHNSGIFYAASNHVLKSLDRGRDLRVISPDITATKQGTASALAESPRDPNVLYVGSDDGNLWVTRDGGKEWKNITKNVGLPGPRGVSSIEASRFEAGRVYVVFDGHRHDDDAPHVYVSQDYGQTWKAIHGNQVTGWCRVLREDLYNPNLLFLGTEFGAWCSLDRGQNWNRLNTNLPTVAVHEFAIHPTSGEVVVATHGRSVWIADISALRQINNETAAKPAQLYRPISAIAWEREVNHGRTGRRFVGSNPVTGASVYYSLAAKAEKVTVRIQDANGKQLREFTGATTPGLHRVTWDLTSGGGVQPKQAGSRPSRGFLGRPVGPGTYRVVLVVDGKETSELLRVEADPSPRGMRGPAVTSEEDEEDDDEQDMDGD